MDGVRVFVRASVLSMAGKKLEGRSHFQFVLGGASGLIRG
jgi:hypothetical protein